MEATADVDMKQYGYLLIGLRAHAESLRVAAGASKDLHVAALAKWGDLEEAIEKITDAIQGIENVLRSARSLRGAKRNPRPANETAVSVRRRL